MDIIPPIKAGANTIGFSDASLNAVERCSAAPLGVVASPLILGPLSFSPQVTQYAESSETSFPHRGHFIIITAEKIVLLFK